MNLPYFLTEFPYFHFENEIDEQSITNISDKFAVPIRHSVNVDYFVAKYLDLTEMQKYRHLVNMRKLLACPDVSMETILQDEYQQVVFLILMQYYFSI